MSLKVMTRKGEQKSGQLNNGLGDQFKVRGAIDFETG